MSGPESSSVLVRADLTIRAEGRDFAHVRNDGTTITVSILKRLPFSQAGSLMGVAGWICRSATGFGLTMRVTFRDREIASIGSTKPTLLGRLLGLPGTRIRPFRAMRAITSRG